MRSTVFLTHGGLGTPAKEVNLETLDPLHKRYPRRLLRPH